MSTATVPTARHRKAVRRYEAEVLSRLRKTTGQLAGVTSMYEDGRYCIEVLDQLPAVTAAVDAVAVPILTEDISACIGAAIATGDTEEQVGKLVTAVRRYVRSP